MVIERQTKFSWSIGFLLALHWYCVLCFSIAYLLSIFSIIISIGIGGRMLAGVAYFVSVLHFFYQYFISLSILSIFVVSVLALVVGCWHLGNLWTVCQLSKLRPSQIEKWKDITHIFKSEKWKDITYLFKKWKDNPSFQRWKDITHLFKSEKI